MTAPKAAASVSGTSSSKVKGSVLQGHSNILALNLDLQSTVIRKKCQSESVCVCVCVCDCETENRTKGGTVLRAHNWTPILRTLRGRLLKTALPSFPLKLSLF